MIKIAEEKIMVALGEGSEMKEVWDYRTGIILAECGRAHTYYWIVQNFIEKINNGSKN
jgi:hypothetical protein